MTKSERSIIREEIEKLEDQLEEWRYDYDSIVALENKIETLRWVLSISECDT